MFTSAKMIRVESARSEVAPNGRLVPRHFPTEIRYRDFGRGFPLPVFHDFEPGWTETRAA